jgi:hypothetical protein
MLQISADAVRRYQMKVKTKIQAGMAEQDATPEQIKELKDKFKNWSVR